MKSDALIIGVCGVARSGKDTFAALAKKSCHLRGKKIRTLAFADKLKENAATFLSSYCRIDNLSTLSTDKKAEVRPFLVWYGCYMRSIEPDYWLNQVMEKIENDNETDIFIITDVRFENELKKIVSLGGSVIHIRRTLNGQIVQPANEEERKNDPILIDNCNTFIVWNTVTDNHLDDLQQNVDDAILYILPQK